MGICASRCLEVLKILAPVQCPSDSAWLPAPEVSSESSTLGQHRPDAWVWMGSERVVCGVSRVIVPLCTGLAFHGTWHWEVPRGCREVVAQQHGLCCPGLHPSIPPASPEQDRLSPLACALCLQKGLFRGTVQLCFLILLQPGLPERGYCGRAAGGLPCAGHSGS